MNKLTLLILTLVSALLLTLHTAFAAASSVVVNSDGMQGWKFTEDKPSGSGTFVDGPDKVSSGNGSAQLTVDANGSELLSTTAFAGTKLKDIDKLEYSSYSQGTTIGRAPSLQFDVDYDLNDDNPNWQGRLVYEPHLNNPVDTGIWQTWNPLDGVWYVESASKDINCLKEKPCSFKQLIDDHPNIGIKAKNGATHFKVGGPWTEGFTGNIDYITIGVKGQLTTYDFE